MKSSLRAGAQVKVEIRVQQSGISDLLPETEAIVLVTDTLGDGPSAEHVVAVDGPAVPLVDGRFMPADRAGRLKLNAWATVMHTVQMYEQSLGSRIHWSFGPRLGVEASAGQMQNAFYDPRAGRIRLFHFVDTRGERFDTAESRDIVAHETGHAIFDALCPDLANSLHPDGLAVHEAVADLTAMLSVLGADGVARALAGQPMERFPAFLGDIAEGFRGSIQSSRMGSLRSLGNDFRLPGGDSPPALDFLPEDDFGMDIGPPVPTGLIDSIWPHDRSQVLSGAMFNMLLAIRRHHEESAMELDPARWDEISAELAAGMFENFSREILPPLLYLPPGELQFDDFVRTYLALDNWSWGLSEDAPRRGLSTPTDAPPLPGLGDDWSPERVWRDTSAARDFVESHRSLLGLPPGVPFELMPRLRRSRETDFREVEEVIMKVSWECLEPNSLGPPKRAVRMGTTLAFDLQGAATVLLAARPPSDASRQARDEHLVRLQPLLGGGVDADDTGGVLRVRGTVRTLHVLAEELDNYTSTDGGQR
jgi:hypothetical protein